MAVSAGIAAFAALAGSAYSAHQAKKVQAPTLLGPPVDPNKEQGGQEAARRARKDTAAAQGRSATFITGPQGLGEVPDANRQSKTLIGY